MYYGESSHANKWLLSSHAELNSLRERANRRARDALSRALDVDGCVADDNNRGAGAGGGGGVVVATEETSREGGRVGGSVGGNAAVDDGDSPSKRPLCEVYGFDETRVARRPKSTYPDDDGGCIASYARPPMGESDPHYGPTRTAGDDDGGGGDPLLTPADESTLVSFYCSKIPLLIGPHAALPRCRRDAKVASTACALFRRFYLSNSVMAHDPKSMLAAAAFLAAKVEDCMISAACLEMGTGEMNAPVPVRDILDAEVRLVRGVDFELLVFSPYKTVLSYTEDLRTFLKTERGAGLVTFPDGRDDEGRGGGRAGRHGRAARVELAGEDLRPMHDAAMRICDDVIVSDLPLMFAPGEVGLATLMIANEYVDAAGAGAAGGTHGIDGGDGGAAGADGGGGGDPPRGLPRIDVIGYVRSRFQDATESDAGANAAAIDAVTRRVSTLGQLVRELREGKHGCGNYGLDMDELKGINKKLKKCRAWGLPDKKEEKKKKKKKRKAEDA
jgi:cyclin H